MKHHFTLELYDNHSLKPPIVALTEVGILDVFSKKYQKVSTDMKSCKLLVMSHVVFGFTFKPQEISLFTLQKQCEERNDGFD